VQNLGITLNVSWYLNNDENIPPSLALSNTIGGKLTQKSGTVALSSKRREGPKFTCRFDIQIENDKDFQVARKLIGSKGCNMKKIVEMCTKDMMMQAQDVVKLRLRGKGSGFKEGPSKLESEEPLHLCISSKFQEKY
jgi:hypothetical protein